MVRECLGTPGAPLSWGAARLGQSMALLTPAAATRWWAAPSVGFHGNAEFLALGRREQPWRRSLSASMGQRGLGMGLGLSSGSRG